MASATLFSPLNHPHQNDPQSYLDFDSPSHLSNSIRHWSYREVSNFIVKLLCLPRQLELDIRCFIVTREIDGTKLLSLDEVQLKRLGFNKKWCHTLSVAIRDLKRSVTPTPLSPLDLTEHNHHHLTTSPTSTLTSRHVTTGDSPSSHSVASLKENNSLFHDAIKTAQHFFTRSNLPTSTPFDTPSLQDGDENVVGGTGGNRDPPTPWSAFTHYTLNFSVMAALSIFVYRSCHHK